MKRYRQTQVLTASVCLTAVFALACGSSGSSFENENTADENTADSKSDSDSAANDDSDETSDSSSAAEPDFDTGADTVTDASSDEDTGVRPRPDSRFQDVAAGLEHTCALAQSGDLFCFGAHNFGQLGIGPKDMKIHATPEWVGTEKWAAVAPMAYGTCALRDDGQAYCWGYNSDGQLGAGKKIGSVFGKPQQMADPGRFDALWTGWLHGFGYDKDTLYAWGMNIHGQLANGQSGYNGADKTEPIAFGENSGWDKRFVKMAMGHFHTCGITEEDRALYCWGSYDFGQLGDGRTGDGYDNQRNPYYIEKKTPLRVGSDAWKDVAALEGATCGIKADGTLWCFGMHTHAELGIPEDISMRDGCLEERAVKGPDKVTRTAPVSCPTPQRVGADADWVSISGTTAHACAVKNDSSLWCWGYNEYGMVGDGTAGDMDPKNGWNVSYGMVQIPGSWKKVSAGAMHTCAVDGEDELYCWGRSSMGQCGVEEDTVLSPNPISLDLPPPQR